MTGQNGNAQDLGVRSDEKIRQARCARAAPAAVGQMSLGPQEKCLVRNLGHLHIPSGGKRIDLARRFSLETQLGVNHGGNDKTFLGMPFQGAVRPIEPVRIVIHQVENHVAVYKYRRGVLCHCALFAARQLHDFVSRDATLPEAP